MKKKSLSMYIIVAAAFLLLVGDSLLTTGMFMDGLIYSNIAANLAGGVGDPWHLVHSDSFIPEFYGHPPLGIWILSLFYSVFGSVLWVTRLYAMVVVAVTALLILRLWKITGHTYSTGWLPLLFWTMVPVVTLSSHNVMLECTMAVFDLSAVLCLMHPADRPWKRLLWAAAGGGFIFLAFLTKGFTGIYPLALPGIVWLVDILSRPQGRRLRTIGGAIAETFVAVLAAGGCVGMFALCWPEAVEYLEKYMNIQVFGQMATVTVDSRLYIVESFFKQGVIVLVLFLAGVAGIILTRRKGRRTHPGRSGWRTCCIFVLLTMAGVLPIMVSTKQRDFYILTVYPFYALGMAAPLHNAIYHWLRLAGRGFSRVSVTVATVLLGAGIGWNAVHYGKPGRDIPLQNDMKKILTCLDEGERVGIPARMQRESSLHAYYYREKRIALIPVGENDTSARHRHLLTDGRAAGFPRGDRYQEIALGTEAFKLFERKGDEQ